MDNLKEINYGEAIYEGCYQEMEKDDSVFVYGLGVDDPKGHYGTSRELHKAFGEKRNFGMPLSEDAMTGVGIGAALAGLRPIYVHQRMDFLLLCMNQLVNMAAKLRYMSSGQHSVPLVVRAAIGRSWGQGAQHSQSFHSYFMHIPGIKVVAPTTPHDAKGCLIASIRDNNPVIFLEHRMLYSNKGYVPCETYEVEFGKGRVLVEGTDITLVGVSYTVTDCIRAALALKKIGISAEVIDPVSLSPIDYEIIRKSANKTKKVLVVDNGWITCGFSAEIIADLGINCSGLNLDRMGYLESPCPTTRVLEDAFYPSPETVAIKANQMCSGDTNWKPEKISRDEINSFKGPF